MKEKITKEILKYIKELENSIKIKNKIIKDYEKHIKTLMEICKK